MRPLIDAIWPYAGAGDRDEWAGRAEQELVEIVTPRTNAAAVTAAEHVLASVSLPEPFSLELGATAGQRWLLARAGSPAMRRHLEAQLGAFYPQAELRRLDAGRVPGLDPARRGGDERVEACALALRAPPYLPLRTFRDADLAADRAPHAAHNDPLAGILGAMGDLPDGWRALSQLVLRPAPEGWSRPYPRMALEHPLERERLKATAAAHASGGAGDAGAIQMQVGMIAAGMVALYVGLRAYNWYLDDEWLPLFALALAVLVGVPALVWGYVRLKAAMAPAIYDPKLVEEKISHVAFVAELHLAVFAPAGTPRDAVRARLRQMAAAYRPFDLPNGSGLNAVPLGLDERNPDALRTLEALEPRRAAALLNVRELAGLWHPPQGLADVPLLERTAARSWQPLPADVAPERGCRVGVSAHQGRSVPVAVPDELLLRRHSLLVAKTQRGKSSLLCAFGAHIMRSRGVGAAGVPYAGGEPASGAEHGLLVVDPHGDLVRQLLGLVPAERRGDVVFLDLAAAAAGERPFGLNLLDVGLGWTGDKAVANALLIFEREFGRNWGPRMEDAFRFALKTLWAANERLRADDDGGAGGADARDRWRERQYTVLEVPLLLADPRFADGVLRAVSDHETHVWWDTYYRPLTRAKRLEIINPVQTKVQKFAGKAAGRNVVGQPRSTIDPAAWLREGKIVLVDAAKGVVGEDTAALVGGTLLNLFKEVVGEQAALPSERRRRVTIVVDEFQSLPGADYEALLSEMAKYGANLVLATQSLGVLDALDHQHDRALRATVFANVDGLFVFHCSAADAEYLVKELGGGVEPSDLLELGEHRCYAKLSARGARLPVFSLQLDPPPEGDARRAAALARDSARRWGRPIAEVCALRLELAERIAEMRGVPTSATAPVVAVAEDPSAPTGGGAAAGGAPAGVPRGSSGVAPTGREAERRAPRSRGRRGERTPKSTAADRIAAGAAPLPLQIDDQPGGDDHVEGGITRQRAA